MKSSILTIYDHFLSNRYFGLKSEAFFIDSRERVFKKYWGERKKSLLSLEK